MPNNPLLILLIIATLLLSTVAYPNLQPREAVNVTTIPLRRRTALKGFDGVFDYEKAQRSTAVTMNKYHANKMNIDRNLKAKACISLPIPTNLL